MTPPPDIWRTLGLAPYPAGAPPIDDPRALDDTELLRRLVPLVAWVARTSPKPPGVDCDALCNRILFGLFRLARRFDPAKPVALATMLMASGKWYWRHEAAEARLVDRSTHRGGRPLWVRVGEGDPDAGAAGLIDLLPSREPDPAGWSPAGEADDEADDKAELILANIAHHRRRQAVRLYVVAGLHLDAVGRRLGVCRQQAQRLVADGMAELRTHMTDPREG